MTGFDPLSPETVLSAVEGAFDLSLKPLVTPYPSYVNRVYGIEDQDGIQYVVKFYRPDRWTREALEEEHDFTLTLAGDEFPVVAPLEDVDGDTLAELQAETPAGDFHFHFALFPKRSGRLFDAESDESWRRIGSLCGRLHMAGAAFPCTHRQVMSPDRSTREHLKAIKDMDVVPADMRGEWTDLTGSAFAAISPLFHEGDFISLHGDLHRGNILDRGDEGLLLIDLDDMSRGPAMQDLWLLMPARYGEVGRETALLADGYEEFRPFPWNQLKLMEPLRLMRLVHFIAWCGRQRFDRDFRVHFPDWGSRSWWITEMEE